MSASVIYGIYTEKICWILKTEFQKNDEFFLSNICFQKTMLHRVDS